MSLIQKATGYAVEKHCGQFRKGGLMPYIVHPIEVMKRVASYGIDDEDILCAAVLHDVMEDCGVSFDELVQEFGERIAGIVQELTHPEWMSKDEYMGSFSDKSHEAIIIKLVDRYCNVMDFIQAEKFDYAQEYSSKANHIYERAFTEIGIVEMHIDCQKLMSLQGLSLNLKYEKLTS